MLRIAFASSGLSFNNTKSLDTCKSTESRVNLIDSLLRNLGRGTLQNFFTALIKTVEN